MADVFFSKRYEKAKTAVFWDMGGCPIPDGGGSAIDVSKKIRSALKKKNYLGTTTVYAYGDTEQIRERLGSAAFLVDHKSGGDVADVEYCGTTIIYENETQVEPEIVLNHTPAGDKDARLKKFLVGLFLWATDNPGPANLMIILEDISTHNSFFAGAMHRLNNGPRYNILLVQPQNAPPKQLMTALFEKWLWESIVVAEEFVIFPGSQPAPSLDLDMGDTSSVGEDLDMGDTSSVGEGRRVGRTLVDHNVSLSRDKLWLLLAGAAAGGAALTWLILRHQRQFVSV